VYLYSRKNHQHRNKTAAIRNVRINSTSRRRSRAPPIGKKLCLIYALIYGNRSWDTLSSKNSNNLSFSFRIFFFAKTLTRAFATTTLTIHITGPIKYFNIASPPSIVDPKRSTPPICRKLTNRIVKLLYSIKNPNSTIG